MKQPWEIYSERLINWGFTEEELEVIKEVRESGEYEHCSFEQFQELWKQGIVKRTVKLRKQRNLFVCGEGKFWYFNMYNKKWEYIGHFKTEG